MFRFVVTDDGLLSRDKRCSSCHRIRLRQLAAASCGPAFPVPRRSGIQVSSVKSATIARYCPGPVVEDGGAAEYSCTNTSVDTCRGMIEGRELRGCLLGAPAGAYCPLNGPRLRAIAPYQKHDITTRAPRVAAGGSRSDTVPYLPGAYLAIRIDFVYARSILRPSPPQSTTLPSRASAAGIDSSVRC